MLDNLLKPLLKARAEKRLPQAILKHDLADIQQCLSRGATKIDYLLMREGDRPGEQIPAAKFDDPVKLATYVGLSPAGMALFSRAGLSGPLQQAPRQV